jgi:uncharacterized protein (DUF736 family)
MSEYDNTDRGALFRNDKKEADNHPDYKGSINVGGTDYWLSAWLKTSNAGAKYMSLSVKPKDAPAQKPAPKAPARQAFDDSEDVPFANPYRGRASYVV